MIVTTKLKDRIASRVSRLSLFNRADYLAQNGDVAAAGVDPIAHYAAYGCAERRRPCSEDHISRLLGKLKKSEADEIAAFLQQYEAAQIVRSDVKEFADHNLIGVFIHSRANHYMLPIANSIVDALKAAGARAMLMTEEHPHPNGVTCPIVVSPHEFFVFPLPDYFHSSEFLENYFAYNTEQIPSPWFHECLPTLLRAKGVIDINFQSSMILGTGIPTCHYLPTFSDSLREQYIAQQEPSNPLFKWLAPKIVADFNDRGPIRDRPLDLFFAGHKTEGRTQFFTRNAAYLAEKDTFISYTVTPPSTASLSGFTRALFPNYLGLTSRTKIVLNLHRYPIGFFEWERMVAQGFSSGASVVATPCMRSPFFEPGVHYFEATSRNLDKVIKWLLETEEGAAAAQKASEQATEVLKTQLTAARAGRHLLSFLATV